MVTQETRGKACKQEKWLKGQKAHFGGGAPLTASESICQEGGGHRCHLLPRHPEQQEDCKRALGNDWGASGRVWMVLGEVEG